ncbi:MAG TPA: serine/threonine-protein kinase [Woeseiaceae bacterium]|nr:serine/threonine-protein kinase [Woeseiaceae bacterium]
MTPERWQRVEALFLRCIDLGDPARGEVLAEIRREDAELCAEVERMLRADARGDELREAIGHSAAAAARETADLWCGRELGAYRIERQLASGGMGSVFLASRADDAFERSVAIKLLSSALTSADGRRRFLVERQILASLSHPYIAQLLDGGTTDDGVPYIVMEYVEGSPIDAWCDREGLPLEARLELFLKVCLAVQYAHRQLVVHRDLKPGNILVTADGTPKLLDFGIAKLMDATGTPALTVAEARMLTPMHASPEQLKGEPVTTSSDVYSLGVLLYELLTGCSPYRGPARTPREIEQAICETEPLRPSAAPVPDGDAERTGRRRKALGGDLDTIALKALRKEPDARYQSVAELADDIERYLSWRPIAARPASWRYRGGKFLARRAAELAAGTVVFLLIAGLIVYYTARLATERDLQAQQRETAEQVSDFMVGLFENADPQRGNSDVTARELLAQGREQIDELRESQPLVAASLLVGMGRAHRGLADYDTAAGLLTDAIALRRQYLPAGHADIAEGLHNLGDAEIERRRYAEARELFGEALAIREQALGTNSAEVGRTLYRLAYIHMSLSEHDAMRAALERSLRIHEQALGPQHPDTGNVVSLLGSFYWITGDYAAAGEHLARGLAIVEQAHGTDSIRIAGALHNLGLMTWQLGDYEKAYELYRRELGIKEKYLGPDHPDLGVALYGLAITSKDMGRYGESIDWYDRTVALQEAALGPDDHYLAMTLSGAGFTLLEAGRLAEARAMLERSLAIFERKWGADHLDLRAPLSGLAKVAMAEGRLEEAQASLEQALGIVEAQLAPDHADVLRTVVSLGELHAALGEHTAAAEYFKRGLDGFERTLGLEHPFAAPALAGMGDVMAAAGEFADADRHYARAIGMYEARGQRNPALAGVLERYADLLRRTGRDAEAADHGTRAKQIREALAQSLAPEDAAVAEGTSPPSS